MTDAPHVTTIALPPVDWKARHAEPKEPPDIAQRLKHQVVLMRRGVNFSGPRMLTDAADEITHLRHVIRAAYDAVADDQASAEAILRCGAENAGRWRMTTLTDCVLSTEFNDGSCVISGDSKPMSAPDAAIAAAHAELTRLRATIRTALAALDDDPAGAAAILAAAVAE